jgi:hypothetical protein
MEQQANQDSNGISVTEVGMDAPPQQLHVLSEFEYKH